MMKPVVGVLALALVVGGLAFAIGKATVSDAKSPSQQQVPSTEMGSPTKAPALASTGAIPALRTPKPATSPGADSDSDSGSTSSPNVASPPTGAVTPDTGGSGDGGGGGGGSGGTPNQTPGVGEY
jgi:hypothetical protein